MAMARRDIIVVGASAFAEYCDIYETVIASESAQSRDLLFFALRACL
jgi:hypothetical protein